jgi:ribosomal protein S27AE
MLQVEGKTDRDAFRLFCGACGVETKNEYGQDYRFTATCPSCAQTAILKFDALRWQDLPATPAV